MESTSNKLLVYSKSQTQIIGADIRDRTRTVSGTVPVWNNVCSVRFRDIFCSGAGTC